ncbi:strawberry notch family protein [Nostoc sp. CHAB 5784]|uniref:strawberry notch-like NTP hydrolase domain-containing protein n=1 Tax=Nostoc mirabile TaxID=2907820 RepID=UPI001E5BFB26|nr:strawberry notch family protein [Nostoc mirabile]MCC5669466.1 strawberry notch family protein [Nostoc mirabile CHAB5784]
MLEPSAGTGLLAQMAKLHGASMMLNELAPDRSKILRRLFPGTPLFSVNAEQINDYLAGQTKPSVVLMNPPFSASPNVRSRNSQATARHVNSALQRLVDGGRLVALTANWFEPKNPDWQQTFIEMQQDATVVLSVGVSGKAYAKHGTTIDTRLTVIDKVKAPSCDEFNCITETLDLAQLVTLIKQLPVRPLWQELKVGDACGNPKRERTIKEKTQVKQRVKLSVVSKESSATQYIDVVPLEYEVVEWAALDTLKDSLYETYRPQRVRIHRAKPHPSLLCESAALALVPPPVPTYKPLLPSFVVLDGLLSEAQLESVIYAGLAHSELLSGSYLVDDSFDNVTVAGS